MKLKKVYPPEEEILDPDSLTLYLIREGIDRFLIFSECELTTEDGKTEKVRIAEIRVEPTTA